MVRQWFWQTCCYTLQKKNDKMIVSANWVDSDEQNFKQVKPCWSFTWSLCWTVRYVWCIFLRPYYWFGLLSWPLGFILTLIWTLSFWTAFEVNENTFSASATVKSGCNKYEYLQLCDSAHLLTLQEISLKDKHTLPIVSEVGEWTYSWKMSIFLLNCNLWIILYPVPTGWYFLAQSGK